MKTYYCAIHRHLIGYNTTDRKDGQPPTEEDVEKQKIGDKTTDGTDGNTTTEENVDKPKIDDKTTDVTDGQPTTEEVDEKPPTEEDVEQPNTTYIPPVSDPTILNNMTSVSDPVILNNMTSVSDPNEKTTDGTDAKPSTIPPVSDATILNNTNSVSDPTTLNNMTSVSDPNEKTTDGTDGQPSTEEVDETPNIVDKTPDGTDCKPPTSTTEYESDSNSRHYSDDSDQSPLHVETKIKQQHMIPSKMASDQSRCFGARKRVCTDKRKDLSIFNKYKALGCIKDFPRALLQGQLQKIIRR